MSASAACALSVVVLASACVAQPPGPPFGPEKAYLKCTDVADDCDKQIAGCGSGEYRPYMSAMCAKTCNTCLPDGCLGRTWPNVTNCARWTRDEKSRYVISNTVPPFKMEPYCPFGVGSGYCVPGEENCPFEGMKCPSTDHRWGVKGKGDVLVPKQIVYSIPFDPDPTDESKPKSMYSNNPGVAPVIGVTLSGIDMQGPVEAGGINVDVAGLPLPCGGHVTPPVGTGPLYHFHKAAYCLVSWSEKNVAPSTNGHSPLVGYANDGFGIYGWNDTHGDAPVLDECNGHFGLTAEGTFSYHYHMLNVTNAEGKQFVPYYLGCQGPAKGRCKETADPRGQAWCGPGCGAQLCVQPGSLPSDLENYINHYTQEGSKWLDKFTINHYHD